MGPRAHVIVEPRDVRRKCKDARASVAQRWLEPSLWTGGPKDPHELHALEGRK